MELRCIQLHRGSRRQFLIEWDILGQIARAQVPQLQLALLSMLARQNKAIVHIDGVASDEGSYDAPNTL